VKVVKMLGEEVVEVREGKTNRLGFPAAF